ncbi:Aldo/keto reductase [Mycena alexandri]|uniref:Aldo/keto reductase n=1 Tax=Mycena alexandri TaxID=1745969 RepID=A0AAD6SF96_9AGAR|nr:Aldo/keto reductase [Mycena alexandri]
MTFGAPGSEGTRVDNTKDIEAILDVFLKHGHRELDTARVYGMGTSEEMLGKIDWQAKGISMETKLYPFRGLPTVTGSHSAEDLRTYLLLSKKELNTDKLEMWYLHGPDRAVPYEESFKAINELYREGHFKRFGISNYMAWEVAEIVGICKQHGYVQPSVYQGIYNAIHRGVEPELFPALRKFGIAFYEFNPLAGGFFTNRYASAEDSVEKGSRFDPELRQGKNYRDRYWKPAYFAALDLVRPVAAAHGFTMAEVALRCVSHHSLMCCEHGDSVLIGASSLAHIEQNLVDLEKGPLPDEVVEVLTRHGRA